MSLTVPSDIETNANKIVQFIGHESVDVYRFLSKRFCEQDPKDDKVFQFIFRSFYRLDNAGLSDEFKTKFFELLSIAKAEQKADIQKIVRSLFDFPNQKGQASLQFSFATKLAATVESTSPIYDLEVATIFGFRAPYNYKPFEQRLSKYIGFYTELKYLYQTIIDNRSFSRNAEQCSVPGTSAPNPMFRRQRCWTSFFGLLESYRMRCRSDA